MARPRHRHGHRFDVLALALHFSSGNTSFVPFLLKNVCFFSRKVLQLFTHKTLSVVAETEKAFTTEDEVNIVGHGGVAGQTDRGQRGRDIVGQRGGKAARSNLLSRFCT